MIRNRPQADNCNPNARSRPERPVAALSTRLLTSSGPRIQSGLESRPHMPNHSPHLLTSGRRLWPVVDSIRFIALVSIFLAGLSEQVQAVEPKWATVQRHGPFLVHSEFLLDRYRHVLDSLDTLPARFHKTLDLPVTGQPIHVHLLSSRRRYRAHVRERLPDRGRRRALYLKAPDRGYVFAYRHNDWSRDLHHECTHAMIHNALPYLPLWLDEGLAEYFEGPPSESARSHPHLARLRWSIQLGWTPSLERLESRRGFQSMATRDYRESWAWVHFLLHGPPAAQRALADYLVAIRQNRPPGLFSRWIKPRLPAAADALKMHLSDLSR